MGRPTLLATAGHRGRLTEWFLRAEGGTLKPELSVEGRGGFHKQRISAARG